MKTESTELLAPERIWMRRENLHGEMLEHFQKLNSDDVEYQLTLPQSWQGIESAPQDTYAPFTVELSKHPELQVGGGILLNCPDDKTRLHKILALRDMGDYCEADVELLLKPVSATPAADDARIAEIQQRQDGRRAETESDAQCIADIDYLLSLLASQQSAFNQGLQLAVQLGDAFVEECRKTIKALPDGSEDLAAFINRRDAGCALTALIESTLAARRETSAQSAPEEK